MDPLTQGVLGASLSQSASNKQHLVVAGVLGLLSGLAPDLDSLIKSQSDPLLALEFHRQFTHSLFFIPIGSLICALALHHLIAKRRGLSFKQSWLFCALGYGTHALLDACTTYGTQLLWPFTNARINHRPSLYASHLNFTCVCNVETSALASACRICLGSNLSNIRDDSARQGRGGWVAISGRKTTHADSIRGKTELR
ncbi:metal-dependent hydrolase [Vibrio splendidus]|uniref:metal-dependent hydrolase n=1 Tax=Vibrio splendidus TaxID=29497 RepID=UPI003CE502D8